MMSSHILLPESTLSLKQEKLAHVLINIKNILIIQDLDGVCMGLVKDPLTRVIDTNYVNAAKAFSGHFYVLTNGEHVGERGVNQIIDRAFGDSNDVKAKGLYLPGLAAGGVQWQDCYGTVSHPGVSEAELAFLASVPAQIQVRLRTFFADYEDVLPAERLESCIQTATLDNLASPTANLNAFHENLRDRPDLYRALQQEMQDLMNALLQDAATQGLADSFFVHYAPNLGRSPQGAEIIWLAQGQDAGTTDFQFMLRGAVKEAGVLAILNRYYFHRTGSYPLGEAFNARQAPKTHEELLELVTTHFDPQLMPVIIGVGDTVTSQVEEVEGKLQARRGGSDRNFLQLIQDLGCAFNKGNIVVYVDSSCGEVKNRKPIKVEQCRITQEIRVLEGPCDLRDRDDPLTLNIVFPGGHEQYSQLFQIAAQGRQRLNRTA